MTTETYMRLIRSIKRNKKTTLEHLINRPIHRIINNKSSLSVSRPTAEDLREYQNFYQR